jgi:hypothetical protein
MLGLAISILCGFIYWIVEEDIISHRFGEHHPKVLVGLKWITVLGLIIEHLALHYHALYERLISIIHKVGILMFYGFGDMIIVFNQNYSIIFFMCGHALLIMECILRALVLAIEYIVGISAFAIGTTALFGYLFKKYNKDISQYEYGLYIVYIFTLSLVLATPVVAKGYFGGWFFVVSDVLIGFKIKQFSKLTFPLYYTSLLCLLYLYTTH